MGRRQALLTSILIHLSFIAFFFLLKPLLTATPEGNPVLATSVPIESERRAVLMTPESVREMAPRIPLPTARPQQPRPEEKSRISIGSPSDERARELILRREDDLTQSVGQPGQKGNRNAQNMARREEAAGRSSGKPEDAAAAYGQMNTLPAKSSAATGPRSISGALQRWERDLDQRGVPNWSGSAAGGRQMGPLHFDPEGADFTAWVNHFKNEVYRNWLIPQAAIFGMGGRVDLEFEVARDGRMTALYLLSSSGTSALDRAAANALMGSDFLPLPKDFAPSQVTMRVSFIYGSMKRPS